jgi:hypothetical protein
MNSQKLLEAIKTLEELDQIEDFGVYRDGHYGSTPISEFVKEQVEYALQLAWNPPKRQPNPPSEIDHHIYNTELFPFISLVGPLASKIPPRTTKNIRYERYEDKQE